MKKNLILLIYLSFNFAIGQEINLIKVNKYHYAIFTKEYKLPDTKLTIENRFTPSKKEIKCFENQLHKDFKKFKNRSLKQRNYKKKIIYDNLKKYRRQCLGIINENGNKIIIINFLWKELRSLNSIEEERTVNNYWKKEWRFILGIGHENWVAIYNINKKEIILNFNPVIMELNNHYCIFV